MTVDKSKSSEPNSELQDYVASLLADQQEPVFEKKSSSNVTPFSQSKGNNTQSTPTGISAETTISKTANINVIRNPVIRKLSSRSNFKQIDSAKSTIEKLIPLSKVSRKQDGKENLGAQPLNQFGSASADPRFKNVDKLLLKLPLFPFEELTTEQPASKTNQSCDLVEQATIESTRATFGLRKEKPLEDVLGDDFQTLVFDVNRLSLAIPSIKLGEIINISVGEITPLIGTPDWFMGLIPNEGRNLLVVDTQKFLMPEKASAGDREYNFLIVLDDSNWALACHTVGDAKNLSPEHVRWSSRSSKRPWFAGMLLEHMSALLEVDKLINLLVENIDDE